MEHKIKMSGVGDTWGELWRHAEKDQRKGLYSIEAPVGGHEDP